MSKHVDALLVINNERLRDVYSDISVMNAFGKADNWEVISGKTNKVGSAAFPALGSALDSAFNPAGISAFQF